MSAALKVAAVVAANLAVWPLAWVTFEQPADTGPISGQRDAGRGGPAPVQPQLGEVLDFSELSPVQAYSRPLFSPDRRAWEPPAPPPAPVEPEFEPVAQPDAPPQPAPSIRLIGVSSAGAADMKALLQMPDGGEPVWVLVGDVLEGWAVDRIDPQAITIRLGTEKMTFDLYPEVSSGQ
jgi:hypothetical protein